jgi:hypothetical protein
MGIEKSEFPELEGMEASDEEMTDEEIHLKGKGRKMQVTWGLKNLKSLIRMSGLRKISNCVERSGRLKRIGGSVD